MLACSFISPRDEPTTVILLNGHSSRLPSKSIFFHPHVGAVWISPKKFLPTADAAYIRNPQLVKVQKISLRNVQPQMRCFLPCSLALGIAKEGMERSQEPEVSELKENSIVQT